MKAFVYFLLVAFVTAAKETEVSKGKGVHKIPAKESNTAQLPSAPATKTNTKTTSAPLGVLPPHNHPAVSKTIITTYVATPLSDKSQDDSSSSDKARNQTPVQAITFQNQVLHPPRSQYRYVHVPAPAVVPRHSAPVLAAHPLPAAPSVVAHPPVAPNAHPATIPALAAPHALSPAPSINYGHTGASTIGHRVVVAPPIGYNYIYGLPPGFVIPTPNYSGHSHYPAQYH